MKYTTKMIVSNQYLLKVLSFDLSVHYEIIHSEPFLHTKSTRS